MGTRISVDEALQAHPPAVAGSGGGTAAHSREASAVIIDGSTHWRRWWRDLYDYRGALQSLAWRNVRSRYKQAVLGMSWALLQPAVQVGVFTVFFGALAGIPSRGAPYAVFALAALIPWNLFQKIVSEGATSLVVNQGIITKLFFPRIYLVLASGASAFIDAAVSVVLLAAVMLWYGVAPGAFAVLAVLPLLGVVVLSYGLAALLASLNARWRDVQHTVPFALQVGLFVTPVIYSNTFVPDRWRWVLGLNPLTGYVELFRGAILGLPAPEPRVLAVSFAVSALLIGLGVWQFTRAEATIVDVV